MKVEDYDKLSQDVDDEIKLNKLEKEKIQHMARENVDEISSIDMDCIKEKYKLAREIDEFGIDTLKMSTEKNHLLQRAIGQVSGDGSNGKEVLDGMESLKIQMQSLNPDQLEERKGGILGRLFNQTTTYFDKYKKVDIIIENIIDSLDTGKENLKDDNTMIEIETVSLRELTKRLSKEIELGITMDKQLVSEIDEMRLKGQDIQDIEFIEQEIVFPLRQRVIDLEQMLVVNRQGILSLEAIRRNNNELIRGVDRAKYVTVSALRIATMVASALYDQKVVINKISDLNTSTSNFIESTSRMLKNQSIEISTQASEATISLDTLKIAYAETIEALEIMDNYKLEALPKMKELIGEFERLNNKNI